MFEKNFLYDIYIIYYNKIFYLLHPQPELLDIDSDVHEDESPQLLDDSQQQLLEDSPHELQEESQVVDESQLEDDDESQLEDDESQHDGSIHLFFKQYPDTCTLY